MTVHILPYTEKDRPFLEEGVRKLQNYVARIDIEKNLKSDEDFDATAYTTASIAMIREGNGSIFMAKNATGAFLGFIMGLFYDKGPQEKLESYPSREGKILELYVEESQHGKGIGKKLLERMEQDLKTKGATAVRLECLHGNPAHTFYQKLGYADRMITLYKPLND